MRLLTHNLPSPIGAERRMPIRGELRPLYPAHWPELSRRVRFERAKSARRHCAAAAPHQARSHRAADVKARGEENRPPKVKGEPHFMPNRQRSPARVNAWAYRQPGNALRSMVYSPRRDGHKTGTAGNRVRRAASSRCDQRRVDRVGCGIRSLHRGCGPEELRSEDGGALRPMPPLGAADTAISARSQAAWWV